MIAGAVVAFIWGGLPAFEVMDKPFGLYEMVPGVLANVIVMVIVTNMTKPPSKEVTDTFDAVTKLTKVAERNPDQDIERAADAMSTNNAACAIR